MLRPETLALENAGILAVDDEAANLAALRRVLGRGGYRRVYTVQDPARALAVFDAVGPDLLLLDLHMPGLDGFRVLDLLRARLDSDEYLPVLVLTGDLDESVKLHALAAGARDFLTKPFEATEILLRIRNLLEVRMLHLRLRQENERLDERVRERTAELAHARDEILARLALAAEFRDDETGHHAQRVGELSARIAEALGRPSAEVALLRQAAPLHDIGKIGIPDAILMKPHALSPHESAVMRTHVELGAHILAGGGFPLLAMAEEIALTHHERWDGLGYRGLAGDAIPLSGRIVAVADAFDALTHQRPYKEALSASAALARIVQDRGRHFDPAVVDALVVVIAAGLPASPPPFSRNGWGAVRLPLEAWAPGHPAGHPPDDATLGQGQRQIPTAETAHDSACNARVAPPPDGTGDCRVGDLSGVAGRMAGRLLQRP